ncbi:O-antigen ligase family protein [Billgrantia diversa]|uniref:O-antigen ligase family protein n=1 Tax=Halomonas sp. MCCC 1A13316 TaxID=2733487 RepID=UPI0018A4A702|nr:O-antigen ligase family protein [Halomonas sp. MCCC 1A13316]QOR39031.1 O-antigen ligase family protein [Halomonas sp. MCCC 1A13316]
MRHPLTLLEPGTFRSVWPSPLWLCWLGLLFGVLYAGLRLLAPDVGDKAGTLMAVTGLFAVLRWGRHIRGSAALWLLLAVIVVQLVSWVAGYLHHPEWMSDNPQLDRLAKWFLFVGLAWWLGGSTRATLLLWGLALTGLIFIVFWPEGSLGVWQRGLQGHRADFSIRNAQHDAMLFGTGLIGLACFAGRCWRGEGVLVWGRRLLWSLAFVICALGVVISQTRAVWLALLVIVFAIPLLAILVGRSDRFPLRWVGMGFLATAVLIAIGSMLFHEPVSKRLAAESRIIEQAMESDWKTLPYSSIGNRLLTWRAAVDWIAERPLLGWGEEGRSLVIEHTDWLPEYTREHYGHLHNTFLEILVGYGLLGLAVVLALIAWIGLGTWHAWRAGIMPGDMALFGAGFFIFYVIVNQFEAYGSFWTGVYVQNLVAGGLVTHIWRWQVETGRRVFPSFGNKEKRD